MDTTISTNTGTVTIMDRITSTGTIAGTITRVDLAVVDGGVLRAMWRAPWVEGQAAETHDLLPGRTLYALLHEGDRKGWGVTQFDENSGRLLRGEITRVDFTICQEGVMVAVWPYGWTAQTQPMWRETAVGARLEELVDALPLTEGWITRRWAGGGRAWKGGLLPVRDAYTIQRMRRQWSTRPGELARMGEGRERIDFAYDL